MTETNSFTEKASLAHLLVRDPEGAAVRAFRASVRKVVEDEILPVIPDAEAKRCFPRSAVLAWGEAGLMRERWSGGPHGDLGRAVIMAEELGRALTGGLGTGLGLHGELALSIIRRYAQGDTARNLLVQAMNGKRICCLAVTEEQGGSDIAGIRTVLTREGGGWRLRGHKWFVSPGAEADAVLVLCKASDEFAVAVVNPPGFTVQSRLRAVGQRSLGTSRLTIDAFLTDGDLLVPPGQGLQAVHWGTFHERLTVCALTLAAVDTALAVTVTHMRQRRQFGKSLFQHQALRVKVAELAVQASIHRHALYALVSGLDAGAKVPAREVFGLKVACARLVEKAASECMQIFGGQGYIEDESPFAAMWRDTRAARIGGGTDEVLLEGVAASLRGDAHRYGRHVADRRAQSSTEGF